MVLRNPHPLVMREMGIFLGAMGGGDDRAMVRGRSWR